MRHDEQDLQKAVIQYLRYACPDVLCFHVPNQPRTFDHKARKLGGILNGMGVMPGVADILIFWPSSMVNFHTGEPVMRCGAIELKSAKGVLSAGQKTFRKEWVKRGGNHGVARSIEEVRDHLIAWGAPCRESIHA